MRVSTLVPVLILLTCCNPTPPGLVRIPTVQLKQSQVTLSANQLDFQLDLHLQNPNPFSITLKDTAGQWILDGIPVQQLNLPEVTLPASDGLPMSVQVKVPLPQGFQNHKTHTFRFDGHYRIEAGTQNTAVQAYTLFQGNFRLR